LCPGQLNRRQADPFQAELTMDRVPAARGCGLEYTGDEELLDLGGGQDLASRSAGTIVVLIASYSFRFYVVVTIGFVAVVLEWRAEV